MNIEKDENQNDLKEKKVNFKEDGMQREKSKVGGYPRLDQDDPDKKNILVNLSSVSKNREWVINEEILSKIPQENAKKIKKLNKDLDTDVLDQMRKSEKLSFDKNYYKKVK